MPSVKATTMIRHDYLCCSFSLSCLLAFSLLRPLSIALSVFFTTDWWFPGFIFDFFFLRCILSLVFFHLFLSLLCMLCYPSLLRCMRNENCTRNRQEVILSANKLLRKWRWNGSKKKMISSSASFYALFCRVQERATARVAARKVYVWKNTSENKNIWIKKQNQRRTEISLEKRNLLRFADWHESTCSVVNLEWAGRVAIIKCDFGSSKISVPMNKLADGWILFCM